MIICPFDNKKCEAFEPRGMCRHDEKFNRVDNDEYTIPPCMKLSEKQIRGGYREYPEILKVIDRDRKKVQTKSKSKRKMCKCKK